MGALLTIGKGTQAPDWIRDLLLAKNRAVAAPTFAPDGLYFVGPVYAEHWGLPSQSPAMDWLPG
jgi:tRNA pseudouridine38-40 synthase